MLRKTTCAVGGLVFACAAAYSLSLLARPSVADGLDLRWLYAPATENRAAAKADRLPIAPAPAGDEAVVLFSFLAEGTTIATRSPLAPRVESAVRIPRVRTISIQPVREVPNEDAGKQALPEGCEPAFSPVTTPAYAHISSRCDS